MTPVNATTKDFIGGIKFVLNRKKAGGDTIKTANAASGLAVAYEAARNAVEFRSEHLIRQAAIVRILRRRLILGQSNSKLAPLLVKELVWARYLKDDSVEESKIGEVEQIIDKYRHVLKVYKDRKLVEWVLGLAGCEIEECLVFNPYPQLLINFVSQKLQSRINIFGEDDERVGEVQVYIAVERAFAKNSEIFITYHLLKAMYPEWLKIEPNENTINQLIKTKDAIDSSLRYPFAMIVKKEVARLSPPFNVIREIVTRNPETFVASISDKESFDTAVSTTMEELYVESKGKLLRASTRSIIYIFLTKMVLALALELPFDILLGRLNFLALSINLLFPPTLMFLLNLGVRVPDKSNTERMLRKIDEYIYDGDTLGIITVGKKQANTSIFERIFLVIYSMLFVGVFALIIWGLNSLHFNPVSQLIFLFFLCVVSFFAFKVRSIARDYVYEDEKQGIVSSFIDFLFLPVVRVGQWLSFQISRLNVLGFIFDFIIEAPLKAFLEVIEEWARFVRVKKEEIFSQG